MPSRISVLLNNQTSQVLPDSGNGVGGVAIRSPKGTTKPTYFRPGETARLIELCGDSGPQYPDLLEALEYVQSWGLWVAAPSNNGRYGGVAVTPTGTVALPGGVAALPSNGSGASYALVTRVTLFEKIGVGDGTTLSFGKTLGALTAYVNQSVKVVVDGAALAGFAATDATTEVLSDTATDTGSYVRSTGALAITFAVAPAAGKIIEASYTFDLTVAGAYAVLFSRAPQADYLTIKNSMSASGYIFTSVISGYNAAAVALDKETVSWTLTPGSVDNRGAPNYALSVLSDDDWLVPVIVTNTVTTFVNDSASVDLKGGSRGRAIAGSDLVAGLTYFHQRRTYKCDVFFDASALAEVATEFENLRHNYQKYSKYILPTPIGTDEAAAMAYTPSMNDRGIKMFWNWGLVQNPWNSQGSTWSPLTGEIAADQAAIIVQAFGGMSQAWINENGWGGQLVSGRVIQMYYDPDETTTDAITAAGLNPIVMDPTNGVMILSERTTSTPLSDYSYGSYSGTLDYIVKNVVEQIIPPQIEKFNDESHRSRVSVKCERLLKTMQVSPRNVLYDYAIKCDGTNNTTDVFNNEQFILQIAIQVTRMSRIILVTFINSPTGTDIKLAFSAPA